MSKQEYRRGFIGAGSYSDEINLHVLKEKISFYNRFPELGYKIEVPEHRFSIPHLIINSNPQDWFDSNKEFSLRLIALLERIDEGQLRNDALAAIVHPENFAFRAFRRSHYLKEKYRAIGLDYDRDVIDYNLETEGAEYSAIWAHEPYFNMSIGKLPEQNYFSPDVYIENYSPENTLFWTASSYLQIYSRKGIENSGTYWSIKITDEEPLARKRKSLIQIDWQLPKNIKLPLKYGI